MSNHPEMQSKKNLEGRTYVKGKHLLVIDDYGSSPKFEDIERYLWGAIEILNGSDDPIDFIGVLNNPRVPEIGKINGNLAVGKFKNHDKLGYMCVVTKTLTKTLDFIAKIIFGGKVHFVSDLESAKKWISDQRQAASTKETNPQI
jgi:hypothetical protein